MLRQQPARKFIHHNHSKLDSKWTQTHQGINTACHHRAPQLQWDPRPHHPSSNIHDEEQNHIPSVPKIIFRFPIQSQWLSFSSPLKCSGTGKAHQTSSAAYSNSSDKDKHDEPKDDEENQRDDRNHCANPIRRPAPLIRFKFPRNHGCRAEKLSRDQANDCIDDKGVQVCASPFRPVSEKCYDCRSRSNGSQPGVLSDLRIS
ncbi:hypothetical protein BCR34DRAFT_564949 [Clohesyomyces aquaticus]|uniref:Uncharacterized protein n=1 Tax=Clohesyomyces aquaticus TaxID=1231657 RepID=A0A1Y1ZMY2_9PLEO|nr:hypothetical protein BCR34DRAFT_564949 [Clohesyomyces aquaticus]